MVPHVRAELNTVMMPGLQAAIEGPTRIICLTEETTETLYLLNEQQRIVGISGFTVRPKQARKEKPRVAAFTSANIDKILQLKPDLVLGFSDLQADIAAALVGEGIAVHIFNQRSVKEILDMIIMLGRMVNAETRAIDLAAELLTTIQAIRRQNEHITVRPRVYFEEWDEPLITAIGWVSELIGIAGGIDCFAERAGHHDAKQRIITDPEEVINRAPDIIIGSWCGKKFRAEKVAARPGWQKIPAVQHQQLHEIKSCNILQPGPAAVSDGLQQLCAIITDWLEQNN